MKVWALGYKKTKDKAKYIYKKIGIIKSPALDGDEVSFNSLGFSHLVRKGRIPRGKNEQKRRFRLVPFLEKIITDSKATVVYDETDEVETINRHGEKMKRKSKGHFWNFYVTIEGCQIKVTVRQLNNGKKHFFSVWGSPFVNHRKKVIKRKVTKKKISTKKTRNR